MGIINPAPIDFNPLTPYWTIVTIVFEAGVLGCGSYFVFVKLIPWLCSKETLHEVDAEEKEKMRIALWGLFKKAKRWPDHIYLFMASFTMRGVAFLLLVTVQVILLTSIGWHNPLTWDGLQYDLVFARANGTPNGAHLVSYLPIPALGLLAAWKFSSSEEKNPLLRIYYGSYFGLLIAALGVAIHESLWMVGYYSFYWQYLSWGVLDNVVKDVFFIAMLALFILTYLKFPLRKAPLSAFKGPTIIYMGMLLVWGLLGFHISTINNFIYGQGIYAETEWWGDPLTNGLEVFSWDLLYICMALAIWKPSLFMFLSRPHPHAT